MTRRIFEIHVEPDRMAAMSTKWVTVNTRTGRHVVPILDTRAHEDCQDCWCSPRVLHGVVTHNSADGREDFESGARMRS